MSKPNEDPLTSRGEKLSDLRRRARQEWEPQEAIEAEESSSVEKLSDSGHEGAEASRAGSHMERAAVARSIAEPGILEGIESRARSGRK